MSDFDEGWSLATVINVPILPAAHSDVVTCNRTAVVRMLMYELEYAPATYVRACVGACLRACVYAGLTKKRVCQNVATCGRLQLKTQLSGQN